PPRFLVLLVNYFNDDDTCSFARNQVKRHGPASPGVVIVNNGSRDGKPLRELTQEFPDILLVEANGNIGYLPGAALGLRAWLDAGRGMPDVVILSNNDITIPGPLFGEDYRTAERMQFDILGPDIVSSRLHQHQNPFLRNRISRRRLRMLTLLSSNLALHYLFLAAYFAKEKILSRVREKAPDPGPILPVYGIHGSFMIFHRSFFEKGGTLDYPNTLYGEEIWLGERALRLGLRTGFDPSLKVIHREHSSTGMFKSLRLMRFMHRSYRYLLHHYDDE
ncbi:MAG TPA: hypothetical protein PKG48_14990, partial [Bacteroidales bacterium]|nr:hypothetical protein [Bacteroidales bacterium]